LKGFFIKRWFELVIEGTYIEKIVVIKFPKWKLYDYYCVIMNILKRQTINDLGKIYPRAKKQLEVWYDEVKKARWKGPADIKKEYPKASILKQKRVVFDILGGEFRLVVKVEFEFQAVYILFFGTHQEYDGIDAETVNNY